MATTADATVHVDAPPERVYGLISDVTRMGDWSPECYRCEWVDGATGPEAGARFKGHNKQGWMRWSTTAEVEVADPEREFTFSTRSGDRVATRWCYRMAAAGGGTDLTESCEAVWTPLFVRIAEKTVLRNRPQQLRDGIRTTLARVKAAAEAGA